MTLLLLLILSFISKDESPRNAGRVTNDVLRVPKGTFFHIIFIQF